MGDLATWVILAWLVTFITPLMGSIANSLRRIADETDLGDE